MRISPNQFATKHKHFFARKNKPKLRLIQFKDQYADQDDHIYMFFSGSARMIVSISDLGRLVIDSLKEYIENKRFVVFG